jgi:hypothetical protein
MATFLSIAKKRSSIMLFTAFLFSVMILGSAQTAHATVLISQPDISQEFSNLNNYGQYAQGLGTGLTGDMGSITIYVAAHGQTVTNATVGITDEGATPCTNSGYNGCSSVAGYTSDTVNITGDGTYQFFFTGSPFTFNPTHYYRVSWGSGWNGNIATKGCNTDCFGGDGYATSRFFANGPLLQGHQVDAYILLYDVNGATPPDLSTHIVDFTPEDNATTTNPVHFSLHAYVNPDDIGQFIGVKFTLHNIDQNVLLLSAFSPSDIYLLDGFNATTTGDFYFSTTTTIGEGNYRLEAQLERSYLGGWVINPFSPINQDISHQFIVCGSDCAGTFIGGLSQNGFSELNSIFGSSTATTTASAANCNFTSWNTFSLPKCGAYLFVPGGDYLNVTLKGLKDGVLTRVPWGYFTRVVNIFNSTATSSLPTFTAHIQVGPGDSSTPPQETLTFDPGDMIAGGGTLLNSISDPINGKSVKDVFEPFVQLSIALSVLFTIIADLTGSHRHHTEGGEQKKKLS